MPSNRTAAPEKSLNIIINNNQSIITTPKATKLSFNNYCNIQKNQTIKMPLSHYHPPIPCVPNRKHAIVKTTWNYPLSNVFPEA